MHRPSIAVSTPAATGLLYASLLGSSPETVLSPGDVGFFLPQMTGLVSRVPHAFVFFGFVPLLTDQEHGRDTGNGIRRTTMRHSYPDAMPGSATSSTTKYCWVHCKRRIWTMVTVSMKRIGRKMWAHLHTRRRRMKKKTMKMTTRIGQHEECTESTHKHSNTQQKWTVHTWYDDIDTQKLLEVQANYEGTTC